MRLLDFEVIIFGSDANAYYLARCYHEAYKRKALVVGAQSMSFVKHSRIINASFDPKLWSREHFADWINDYVSKVDAEKIVCISSNEAYASLLVANREKLDSRIMFNYVDTPFLESLMMKDKFYEAYKDSGLLPKTCVYSFDGEPVFDFGYPVIIKPANVITYGRISFNGKKKIYKVENQAELTEVLKALESSGYKDNVILQEYIPGDDSALYDGVIYCNSRGKAELFAFAQIGLQEHEACMIGNAACLINGFSTLGYDESVALEFKSFMESIDFRGLAELDVKYDCRDGKFKIMEINARQGRSSYYVTATGYNLVKYLVDDLVYRRDKDFVLIKDKLLLTYVPKGIIKKYVVNEAFKKEALKLYSQKRVCNPIIYKKDMPIMRALFLVRKQLRYYKAFKNSTWKY